VSGGRGIAAIGVAAICVACGVGSVATGIAGAQPSGTAKQPKVPLKFVKGKVFSDGVVVPGELETVFVTKFPPRANLKVAIEPPPTTPRCGEHFFCDLAFVSPAPGAPCFRSSGKGRAQLSFVMPATFTLEDPYRPGETREAHFVTGQSVHIDVGGTKRLRKARVQSFGFAIAVVEKGAPPGGGRD
jgi:hypothetical protein